MNGICVAPELCQCNNGYELRNESCIPTCSGGCENGICTEPGVCSCLDGFSMGTASK